MRSAALAIVTGSNGTPRMATGHPAVGDVGSSTATASIRGSAAGAKEPERKPTGSEVADNTCVSDSARHAASLGSQTQNGWGRGVDENGPWGGDPLFQPSIHPYFRTAHFP